MKPAPPRSTTPSHEDELHAEAVKDAARTLIRHLRQAYAQNRKREIGNLSQAEILAMAEDVVGAWCRKRVAQATAEGVGASGMDEFVLLG